MKIINVEKRVEWRIGGAITAATLNRASSGYKNLLSLSYSKIRFTKYDWYQSSSHPSLTRFLLNAHPWSFWFPRFESPCPDPETATVPAILAEIWLRVAWRRFDRRLGIAPS